MKYILSDRPHPALEPQAFYAYGGRLPNGARNTGIVIERKKAKKFNTLHEAMSAREQTEDELHNSPWFIQLA